MKSTLSLILCFSLLLAGCAGTPKQEQSNKQVPKAHYDYNSRSAKGLVDDEKTELSILNRIREDKVLRDKSHVNVTSYNGWVLLTGEVPDKKSGFRLVTLARNTDKVRRVFNHVAIAKPSSLGARSKDTWLTTKVKTRLLGDDIAQGTGTKVITERRIVYLMGLVSRQQAERSVEIAKATDGVAGVVNLMQYTR